MIDTYKREARFALLSHYDYFAKEKEDFIEVTEWHNGEGFDVAISNRAGPQSFYLTWGEYKALRALVSDWYSDEDDDECT